MNSSSNSDKEPEISDVRIEEITSSQYIKPIRMHFKQDGKERKWDLLKVHDSVAVLLFHTEKRSFVFVRQFRPAIYVTRVPHSTDHLKKSESNQDKNQKAKSEVDWSQYPSSLGMTYELCAGIVDKDLPLVDIAREEIEEECGFRVPNEKIHKITSCREEVGTSGDKTTLFYAEISEDMRVSDGGGNEEEGEEITLEFVHIDRIRSWIFSETIEKPPHVLFAVLWYLNK